MTSLRDQLLKNGLINQQKIDQHNKEEQEAASEQQRIDQQPVAGKFNLKSGKVVFGSYWNIVYSATQTSHQPATHWPPLDQSGTALSKNIRHWADAAKGDWTVYRAQSKKGLQAYFICHNDIDATKTYFKLGKLAPMSINLTTQEMYDKGVIAIHRYDWDYDYDFFAGKKTPDYECDGQECFFTDPSSLPEIENLLQKTDYLDNQPFMVFKHGCGFTIRDAEYSYARLHMDKETKRVNAFLFYTDLASLRGAKITA